VKGKTMSENKHLASVGFLCEQERRSYFDVLEALTRAGIKPVLTLDLVPYFDWSEASRALEANPPMIRGVASNA
jgi:hypothetical protein